MVIDFHTHIFPETIAERTLNKLALSSHNRAYLKGTAEALAVSMRTAGIDYSVNLPVATKPEQCKTINETARSINAHTADTGLISFGGIHPDYKDYRNLLRQIAASGIKGIKLHPVFQGVPFDDIRYLRIVDCACENRLAIVTHAGYDIGFPGADLATPKHILSLLRQVHPDRLILAHMGGWECWDDVERDLCGAPVYFDTSFSITPLREPDMPPGKPGMPSENPDMETEKGSAPAASKERSQMEPQQFFRIIKKHGADRILFGSDSPWSSQKESLEKLGSGPLSIQELHAIEGLNAKQLLFDTAQG